MTVIPDTELEERKRQKELERLAAIEAKLTDEDKKRIVEEAQRLKEDQEKKQDLSTLPTLQLTDIPMKFEDVPSNEAKAGSAKAEFFPLPTNGVTYIDVRTDFASLTPQEKDLLPLFGRVLTHAGAAGQDYVQIAQRIASYTGGVGAAAQVQPLAANDDYLQSFVISGKALDRNAKPFIDLLTDLTARLEIEPSRLREIIAEAATRLESSISSLGFQFAILLAQSKLSSEGAINDRLQGIGMLHVMRTLAKLEDERAHRHLCQSSTQYERSSLQEKSIAIVVTCEKSMIDPSRASSRAFDEPFPRRRKTATPTSPKP